jgi:hypothetical protein
VLLDNHSAHRSREIRRFLATKPGRFEFVFTPTCRRSFAPATAATYVATFGLWIQSILTNAPRARFDHAGAGQLPLLITIAARHSAPAPPTSMAGPWRGRRP